MKFEMPWRKKEKGEKEKPSRVKKEVAAEPVWEIEDFTITKLEYDKDLKEKENIDQFYGMMVSRDLGGRNVPFEATKYNDTEPWRFIWRTRGYSSIANPIDALEKTNWEEKIKPEAEKVILEAIENYQQKEKE